MADGAAIIEAEDTLSAEGQDTVEAEGEDTLAAEEPEIVIAVEGEEPEADPDEEVEAELGEAGKRALKAAREAQKETARKLREAEARLADVEARTKPPEPEIKKPTLEECGWNEDAYAEKLAAFLAADDKRKVQEADARAKEKADADAYNAKLARYHEDRSKMGVDDDAQARVIAKLNPAQQTALMKYATDPTKLVAGLVRSPKMLAELAGITDIGAFIYQLPTAEGKITVSTKTPPPPESKVRGGGAPTGATSTMPLDKLRAQASDSGDYTAYLAEKRRRAEAGQKG